MIVRVTDDHTIRTTDTPGFKQFTLIHSLLSDAKVESVDSNLQLKSAKRCFEESGGR